MRTNLFSYTLTDLQDALHQHHELPRYRAGQVYDWMHKKGCLDFAKMTTFNAKLKQGLGAAYCLDLPPVLGDATSDDGTRKWTLDVGARTGKAAEALVDEGNSAQVGTPGVVESVFIPTGKLASGVASGSVCISSQVGCALTCSFCHTGTMPKRNARNLKPHEIVGQVVLAKSLLRDYPATGEAAQVSNVVFMGMGEPLLNYKNVQRSIRVLTDPNGMGMGQRRITVSTSGVVPAIVKLGEDPEVQPRLAISLHAPTDSLRNSLVPLNKQYPIAAVLDAVRHYPGRRVTFEYVLLKGVNDMPSCARDLGRLLLPLAKSGNALVNLIPFNPWPGSQFETTPDEHVKKFAAALDATGVPATIRWPRGRDIGAACGQLAVKEMESLQMADVDAS